MFRPAYKMYHTKNKNKQRKNDSNKQGRFINLFVIGINCKHLT